MGRGKEGVQEGHRGGGVKKGYRRGTGGEG